LTLVLSVTGRGAVGEVAFDYDDEYWNLFWKAIDMLKSIRSEYWVFFEVTVPDYPDDYSKAWSKQHCLWVDSYTNIDRTLENVFYVIEHDKKFSGFYLHKAMKISLNQSCCR